VSGFPTTMRGSISIVLPTRNEAENIPRLVQEIDLLLPDLVREVIFVDDSTDGTPDAIRDAAERSRTPISLIHRPPERRGDGLGGAVLEGMRAARGDWICVMDADLQHPPAVIPELARCARRGFLDFVAASRRSPRTGLSPARHAISAAFAGLARVLFSGRLRGVSDPMTGFFLVRRSALDLERLRPRGFKILLEILARHPELRRGNVKFDFRPRHAGTSKASVHEGLVYLSQLARLRLGRVGLDFSRFALVGATGLVVNTLAFGALTAAGGVHYLVAAAVATQFSTVWNFVLIERWVFPGRAHRRRTRARIALFAVMNNSTLLLRGPLLVLLVAEGLGTSAANVASLVTFTVLRFGVADTFIWGYGLRRRTFAYDIHGLVSVVSDVALPELADFAAAGAPQHPTVRVRVRPLETATASTTPRRRVRYRELLGHGFAVDIGLGRTTEIVASPLLSRSPHVLYTNAVEPVLRWTFVRRGWALVHAACIASEGRAHLITARTDTGKTTTVLRLLDAQPWSFLSDDLTLIDGEGRVLSYPKPLTISRHTLQAVQTPLLSRLQRLALVYQSRVHSRTGRRFARLLAAARVPAATVNALVQIVVPPPKYHVDELVPGGDVVHEARLAGLVVIERSGDAVVPLAPSEAVDTLLENSDDAYAFPPYPSIAPFLIAGDGRDLQGTEREIVARALAGIPATLLKSSARTWWRDVPALAAAANRQAAPLRPEPAPAAQ
jgi:dolichol-phosphate mannosyltransferase